MRELPLDGAKMPWIPEGWGQAYEQLAEHSAWYSGDTGELINFYSTGRYTPNSNGRFWGENVMANDKRAVVHTPIAGDIATFSADMLFSEAPEITIPEAYETKNGQIINNKRAKQADDRLQDIIEKGDVITRCLEAAETAAALGGVYLKPTWNLEVTDVPIMAVIQPDGAIPYFENGFLTAVTFHKVVFRETGKVIRLLEHHSKGWINSALYIGDEFVLGRRVPVTYMSETEKIPPVFATDMNRLLCRYVANKRPHKRFRGSSLGMSDLQGVESMMDSLDLTMTSWIRDIRLGRGRIFVPEDVLANDGNGNVSFDGGQEIYVKMDIDPGSLGEKTINATQFQIRTEEHYKTASQLIANIFNTAGYAPQSFGVNLDGNISTESHEIRERKTMITKQKKERFFKEALSDVLHMMLEIDNIHLQNPTPTEFRPNIAFADTLGHSLSSVAKTVQLLSSARSTSIQTRVEMLHPDWSVEEIGAEVERIKQEESMGGTDPLMLGGKEIVV